MSLAKRLLNERSLSPGLEALCVPEEVQEVQSVLLGPKKTISGDSRPILGPVRLQYLKGSAQLGLKLWNLLSPQLPDYQAFGGNNGYPTFSLDTLRSKGLIL